ncbi:MAG: hypothetical protein PHS97_07440 [Oscillospiraceae bacterium]|nr:hypothetical protein [Oscillospiraceae bacterium]
MQDSNDKPTTEELARMQQYQQEQEAKNHYTPRPKWQIIGAWVLIAIMVAGIVNVCYWQINGIPDWLLALGA